MTVTFDFLTLKVVSESREMWATSVLILVFLGLSVLDLGPMYVTDVRQTDVRQHHHFMPRLLGAGHNNRYALKRNGFRSTAQNSSERISGLRQIRLNRGLRVWGGMLEAYHKLHP